MNPAPRPFSPHILVAPLDWGLGHATRCIPPIRELLKGGARVSLAASGSIGTLLQAEFPQLPLLPLKGYNVTYSRNRRTLPFTIATQIPKILSVIQYENHWIKDVASTQEFDGIISDNRYGLCHPQIPSIFLTHQLRIHTGIGADEVLQKLNYRYIDRFTECWIPDAAGSENLAGALSHPVRTPSIPCRYLGPLSRFSKSESASGNRLLLLLSGPEPQRSGLEEALLKQLSQIDRPVTLVRGLPHTVQQLKAPPQVTVYNHLPAAQLQEHIKAASLVIARCGYSTVMDLAAMEKKSILIPTPGQTEQEYLAEHLMDKGYAFCVAQSKFRLQPVLELADSFNFQPFPGGINEGLQVAVSSFLESVCKKQ